MDGFTDEAWGDWVGEVRLGDCVVSVNGKAVEGMEYEGVLDAIRSATIPRRIGFRRFEKGVKSIFRKGELPTLGCSERFAAHSTLCCPQVRRVECCVPSTSCLVKC